MNMQVIEIRPLAQELRFTDDDMIVTLIDGRSISVPLIWFFRLAGATKEQLSHYEILGEGEGLHWPDLDEDLSVKGLLLGTH